MPCLTFNSEALVLVAREASVKDEPGKKKLSYTHLYQSANP